MSLVENVFVTEGDTYKTLFHRHLQVDACLKERECFYIDRFVAKYRPTVTPISTCRNDIFIRSAIVYKTPITTYAGLFFEAADTDTGSDIYNIEVCEDALRAPCLAD
jgi:hypothetical protein